MNNNNNNSKKIVSANLSLTSQLTATSTSRAAFMQSLRWGIWCPFQEASDWNVEEIQLRLHGGTKPNPYGVMVYSSQTSAKTLNSSPLPTPEAAQVIQTHTKSVCSRRKNVNNAFEVAGPGAFRLLRRPFL